MTKDEVLTKLVAGDISLQEASKLLDETAGEAALRESEENYKILVDTSPDGVIMTDVEGRVLFASERVLEMHGSAQVEDLLGRNPLEFIAPEDHHRFLENLARTLERGVTRNIEYSFLRRDGTCFPGEVSAAVVRDTSGGPKAMAVILRDITERKRAQEALQQALDGMQQLHNQLHAVCDGMTDGLIVADIETQRFVVANAAMCKMLGYSEDELLSRSIMDIHPAEDLPAILKGFQAQIEGRLVVYENAPVLRKDGSVFYADIGARTRIYDGRPSVIGIFRDITKRKQAQEALERERCTLKHLLQSSDRERQLIAYEIHDGLAQQVAGALMQFETYDHLKQGTPEDAARAFDAGMTMLRQGHFEARRLIAGVRPPILDESGVVPAVAHLVNEQSHPERPKVEFRSKVEFDRLVPILENAIYRITQEGLANACQHSKSENVKISLLQQADQVRIEVRDWGIGFDPKQVKEGCYGLTGIRERARMLGGKCSIQSTIGKGTRIRVDLPVMPKE